MQNEGVKKLTVAALMCNYAPIVTAGTASMVFTAGIKCLRKRFPPVGVFFSRSSLIIKMISF